MIDILKFIGGVVGLLCVARIAIEAYMAYLRWRIARLPLPAHKPSPLQQALEAIERARKTSHAAIRAGNRISAQTGDEQ
ncbi:MAG TPA: hypothetical protein VF681_09635 [Abditibacteriaceae bacterium]|jgi:hypothetical protein